LTHCSARRQAHDADEEGQGIGESRQGFDRGDHEKGGRREAKATHHRQNFHRCGDAECIVQAGGQEDRAQAGGQKGCGPTAGREDRGQRETGVGAADHSLCVQLVLLRGRRHRRRVAHPTPAELPDDPGHVSGCHFGDCHYIFGNERAAEQFEKTKNMVKLLGIEQGRLRLEWISAAEGARFAQVINEFTDQVRDLGPIPFSKSQPIEQTEDVA
jgi:hypothetical protein